MWTPGTRCNSTCFTCRSDPLCHVPTSLFFSSSGSCRRSCSSFTVSGDQNHSDAVAVPLAKSDMFYGNRQHIVAPTIRRPKCAVTHGFWIHKGSVTRANHLKCIIILIRNHLLLVFQARDDILNGSHPVSFDKACEFGGIQAQIQFGPHIEHKHKPGFLE